MEIDPIDHIMEAAMNQVESSGGELETRWHRDFTEESRVWNVKRDEVCQVMWSYYTRRGE